MLDKSIFKDAVSKLVKEIVSDLSDNDFSAEERLKWSEEDDGGWHGEWTYFPRLRLSALDRYDEYFGWLQQAFPEAFPEYRANRGTRLGYVGGQRFCSFIRGAIVMALKYGEYTLPLSQEAVDKALKDFWRGFEVTSVDISIILPLQHFTMSSEQLKVADEITLRKLSIEEINDFYGGSRYNFSIDGVTCTYALEGGFSEPVLSITDPEPETQSSFDYAREIGERIVRVLKIITNKDVRINKFHLRSKLAWTPFHANSTFFEISRGTRCKLEEDEEAMVSTLYTKLANLDEASKNAKTKKEKKNNLVNEVLGLAARRLADAQSRRDPGDKIIDSVIALEALLLYGLEQGEYSYKFRMNYAALGKSREERLARMQRAKLLYTARSKLSHGVYWETLNSEGKPYTVEEIAKIGVSIAKEIVLKALLDDDFKFYEKEDFWETMLLDD